MIAFVAAVLVLSALAFVLLRHADRWAWRPPCPPPATSDFPAEVARMKHVMAQVGTSMRELLPSVQRAADAMALLTSSWTLAYHVRKPGTERCAFDGRPFPCPSHKRLTEQVATLRARLGPTAEKLSADPSTL